MTAWNVYHQQHLATSIWNLPPVRRLSSVSCPFHSSCGSSTTSHCGDLGSILGQFTLNFVWKKRHWSKLFFEYISPFLPVILFVWYPHLGLVQQGSLWPQYKRLSHTLIGTLNCHSFIISIVLSTNTGLQIIILWLNLSMQYLS